MSNQRHVYGVKFLGMWEVNLTEEPDQIQHKVSHRLPIHLGVSGPRVGFGFPRWNKSGSALLVLDLLFNNPIHGEFDYDGAELSPNLLPLALFWDTGRGSRIDKLWLDTADSSYYSVQVSLERHIQLYAPSCTCGAGKTNNPLTHSDWCDAWGPNLEAGINPS